MSERSYEGIGFNRDGIVLGLKPRQMFEGTTKNANMQENVQFLFRSRGERYVVKRHELRHSISCYKKKSGPYGQLFAIFKKL